MKESIYELTVGERMEGKKRSYSLSDKIIFIISGFFFSFSHIIKEKGIIFSLRHGVSGGASCAEGSSP